MSDRDIDRQLVARAQRGDKQAFELLVEKYQRKLARLLSRFIRDPAEVEDVLLAHSWEGELLTREHGGPVRVVIPKWYFWKSAKWIRRIEFLAEDRPGFWELRGYSNTAEPWLDERYAD